MEENKDKKSLISRFIASIKNLAKNSILADILIDSEAGLTPNDPEDISTEKKISDLAHETNTPEQELWNYEEAFNEADNAINPRREAVSEKAYMPDIETDSFEENLKVNPSDLKGFESSKQQVKKSSKEHEL